MLVSGTMTHRHCTVLQAPVDCSLYYSTVISLVQVLGATDEFFPLSGAI